MPENVFRFDSSHLERFGGGPSRARSIAWCPIEAGSGVSKISIPLPDGRQLVTLQDACTYITTLPEARAHRAGMANGDGSIDACREGQRSDNDGAHRRHESAQPPRRARVQS